MTSEDLTETGEDQTPCTRGAGRYKGTRCPGADACLMVRSANLSAAYVAGCRSGAAREAGSARAVLNRAKRQGNAPGTDDGAWPDASAPERERTGESCPSCGEPLYHETTRAGVSCDNGHWFPGNRHAPEPTAKVRQELAPTVSQQMRIRIELKTRKTNIVKACNETLNDWLDPNLYIPNTFQYRRAEELQIELAILRDEAVSAPDMETLIEAERLINIFNDQRMLQYKADFQIGRALLGQKAQELESSQDQLAITQGEFVDDDEDDDEDDYDYEESEPAQTRYASSDPLMNLTVSMMAQKTMTDELKTKNGPCAFQSEHARFLAKYQSDEKPYASHEVFGTKPDATLYYRNNAPTIRSDEVLRVCPSDKCRTRALNYWNQQGWSNIHVQILP